MTLCVLPADLSLSPVNPKLDAAMEQHVLAAVGSTFLPHCSTRLPGEDGTSAYHHLKSHEGCKKQQSELWKTKKIKIKRARFSSTKSAIKKTLFVQLRLRSKLQLLKDFNEKKMYLKNQF